MRTRHNQHEPPLHYTGKEEFIDWKNPSAVRRVIDAHLFMIGLEAGLQAPSELAEILSQLMPGDDHQYLGLDRLRVYCETLLTLDVRPEIRKDVQAFIAIIRAFDAGLTVASQSDDSDERREIVRSLNGEVDTR